ncbi:hypothetical protein E2C01_100403 [Portunus trituberculatus]|uniref:Uncharacterized protein n=1 Tax=Portunus trituberculatus TaxID=210409 RepID=A0A5B7KC52_PORTR|nr:hypothetical protein [Portunus trituberculatus]
MPADVRKHENTRTVGSAKPITQSRMPSIEIAHVHRAPYRKVEEEQQAEDEQGQSIHYTGRGAQKTVSHRAVDLSHETIPYHMTIGDISRKGRSLRRRIGLVRKSLL